MQDHCATGQKISVLACLRKHGIKEEEGGVRGSDNGERHQVCISGDEMKKEKKKMKGTVKKKFQVLSFKFNRARRDSIKPNLFEAGIISGPGGRKFFGVYADDYDSLVGLRHLYFKIFFHFFLERVQNLSEIKFFFLLKS